MWRDSLRVNRQVVMWLGYCAIRRPATLWRYLRCCFQYVSSLVCKGNIWNTLSRRHRDKPCFNGNEGFVVCRSDGVRTDYICVWLTWAAKAFMSRNRRSDSALVVYMLLLEQFLYSHVQIEASLFIEPPPAETLWRLNICISNQVLNECLQPWRFSSDDLESQGELNKTTIVGRHTCRTWPP